MGKPKIRFKGYTEDWEQRKLGNVYGIRDGRSIDIDGMKTIEIPYRSFRLGTA